MCVNVWVVVQVGEQDCVCQYGVCSHAYLGVCVCVCVNVQYAYIYAESDGRALNSE